MRLYLENQVVLVTGGSKGIGLACARLFLEEGARVAICSRSRANVDRALAQLPGLFGITADLAEEDQALAMVDKVEQEVGPIDCLINSAGAAKRTPPSELSPTAWRAAMNAKYFSYINVIDPVVKRMAQRGAGVIVNIIGSGGKVATPAHIAGGAANAALMLATAGLANAYARQGVRVVGINPGRTETDRVAEGTKAEARLAGITEAEALQEAVKRIPLGRIAQPGEIAQLALFLASRQASYVTGVNISMDGAASPVVI